MQSQIEQLGVGRFGAGPKFTRVADDRLIVPVEWHDAEGRRDRRYQVLTIRDDRIADMQTCGTWRQAKRFARRVGR